jgi:ubiquinone/menaquinone biosynthesis C-methylase UbiE
MSNSYIKSLLTNPEITNQYYKKSIIKTEQQKYLESILNVRAIKPTTVADIACGGGTLSYHLSHLYPDADFHLTDLNPDGLEIAKDLCRGDKFHFFVEDLYAIQNLPAKSFDLVFCWQTLSWINDPEIALKQLLNLLKSGGRLYVSALFNLNHDVDIYASVKDNTRMGAEHYSYNTYSKRSVEKWIGDKVKHMAFHSFDPEIDFEYEGLGLGTYTVKTENKRLQISGGILLNWAILEAVTTA